MRPGSWSSWRAAGEPEGRDDDDSPHPITRVTCRCGTVLADPPGATAEEVIEGDCRECAAAREAREAEDRDAYSAALREQMEAEAPAHRCDWCGGPSTMTPCPDCRASYSGGAVHYDGDEIPW